MRGFRLTVWAVLGVLLLMSESVWAAQAVQKQQKGGMQEMAPGGMQMQKGQTAPPIKVEATALTVTPASPQSGDQVTVKLTIKNTGTGTVTKVPWSIHYYTGNQTLAQGEQTNVGAGATFEVTATWQTKAAGWQKLQGYVDPTGKALANTAPVSSQMKEINVLVYQTQAKEKGGSAKLVQQILSGNSAKQAGAQFSVNPESPNLCVINQISPKQKSVGYFFICPPGGGGRANPEAFANFKLKHGWKVKAVNVDADSIPGTSWQWTQRPAEGSDDPYSKIHFVIEAGTTDFKVDLTITIEGPEGTNPYTN